MKVLDSKQCDLWYQALLERDSGYTGVFYVGVKTTGVFCIAVCRARKPKRENVEFYTDFKSALDAGYRPVKCVDPLKMRTVRRRSSNRRLSLFAPILKPG